MNYRSPDFYEKMGCEVIYGKKASNLDKKDRKVKLYDGTELPYTSVCIATGSSPFIPPFEGLETVRDKFSFMTLDDMFALENAVCKDSRVLIIGAGLIGLKCAEGLRDRAASITVCDLADRVLSSILDADCAEIVQRHLEANDIQFMLGDSASRFDGNTAVMKSGKTVDFDILVLAVGVRANTELVKNIGGEVNRGIIVNDRMESSLENIYAAGDCTEGNDISLGAKRVLALLPNAYMQGHTAGVNMAGGEEVFDKAIPMNSIGFFGLHMMTAGTYDGEMYEEKTESTIKRLFTKDGKLKGFILIGGNERAGIYTSLIREQTPLDTINFELMKKNATSFAFSSENRRKSLEVWYNIMIINANELDYRVLNDNLRKIRGYCTVRGCCGQRFIAAGMSDKDITIDGVPGNALGAYLNGATITVNANAQDAVGDTMNEGKIIIYGNIGDAAGYAMRGGKIFVKGNAGYRAGIHMKAYKDKVPVMVIGGTAGSFLGEYQAGGVIVVLDLEAENKKIVGFFPCTGMHGGKMFLRSECKGIKFPSQVTARPADGSDREELKEYVSEYCQLFGYDINEVLDYPFTVITPDSKNPYKQMYVAN